MINRIISLFIKITKKPFSYKKKGKIITTFPKEWSDVDILDYMNKTADKTVLEIDKGLRSVCGKKSLKEELNQIYGHKK